MEVPPEITFHGLEKSDEIETHILKKAAKLDEINPGSRASKVEVAHVDPPEGWKS